MNFSGSQYSKEGIPMSTQQQQYLMQRQMQQLDYPQSYNEEEQNYDYDEEQQPNPDASYRSSSQLGTPDTRYSSKKDSSICNQRTYIRVRPPLPREQDPSCPFRSCLHISPDNKSISLMEYMGAEVNEADRQRDIQENPQLCVWHNFTFDYVYDPSSTQNFLYDNAAKPAVNSILEGYNATILAYGQTGTGKTYTMEGFKYSGCDPQRGIVPRSMEQIFKYIEASANRNTTFMVRASYLQIYNEVISDLLKTDRTSLNIREDKKKGIFVEGLSEWAVRSPNEIYSLMQKGAMSRKTAWTNKNDVSSRSHAVFIIIVEQMKTIEGSKQIKVGKLNLVDLAGSESVRITGATGERLEESKKINQSLSCLGNVIAALTDVKPRSHIPYRDSKLTRLLKDSLGGNCKTTMMMMVSPAPEAFNETASTLKFGMRAKKIKNDARINVDVDQRALLRKYEIELRKLKAELERKSNFYDDPTVVTQLEEEKRRAEEDKEAAINALEVRSREYMIEREEKMRLEEKIKLMNSQMLHGGKIEGIPQFRVALEKKHKQIRDYYDEKLKEVEKERETIEEEKAQVDRYKQLLIKQRDIMIALTNRLNERDETIIQLQEELDAYDKIHMENEMNMESRSQKNEEDGQNNLAKRYQPYQNDKIGNEDMPMRLLSADEKVEELMQIIGEQKHMCETLEQERAELIDSKADFMSEKINEIVNREVKKELERVKNGQEQFYHDEGEGSEEEQVERREDFQPNQMTQEYQPTAMTQEYQPAGIPQDYHQEEQEVYDQEYEGEGEGQFYDENEKEEIKEMGYNFGSGPNKENDYAGTHYPDDYESVNSFKQSQSSYSHSSYQPSSSMGHEKVYNRRLPPNVEEMLKQKRQQMANRLA